MLKDITLGQFFPGNTVFHKLDPRTKLILVMQLTRDNVDVVDLVFRGLDTQGRFVFVLVHPDGAEQQLVLPPTTYEKLAHDVRELLFTPRGFITVDLAWAKDSLDLLNMN